MMNRNFRRYLVLLLCALIPLAVTGGTALADEVEAGEEVRTVTLQPGEAGGEAVPGEEIVISSDDEANWRSEGTPTQGKFYRDSEGAVWFEYPQCPYAVPEGHVFMGWQRAGEEDIWSPGTIDDDVSFTLVAQWGGIYAIVQAPLPDYASWVDVPEEAGEGQTVPSKLAVDPDAWEAGYRLVAVTVTDAEGNVTEIREDASGVELAAIDAPLGEDGNRNIAIQGFTMPGSDATIAARLAYLPGPTDWAELRAAFQAPGIDEVTLMEDVAWTEEDLIIYVPQNRTVTLDLNGHVLDGSGMKEVSLSRLLDVVIVMGNLTVKDSQEGGVVVAEGVSAAIMGDEGSSFTLESGTISGSNMDYGDVLSYGTVVINGGRIEAQDSYVGVYMGDTSCFIMTGGEISTQSNDIGAFATEGEATMDGGVITDQEGGYGGLVVLGSFTMNDGSINFYSTGEDYAGLCLQQGGTCTMNGGSIFGKDTSTATILVHDESAFVMNGGTITDQNGDYGSVLVTGTFTMNDGRIICDSSKLNYLGVCVPRGGTFTMNDGVIEGQYMDYATVTLMSQGRFTLNGGTVMGRDGYSTIFINNGTLAMTGGTILGENVEKTVDQRSAFEIEGNVTITGLVDLAPDKVIALTGALGEDVRVEVGLRRGAREGSPVAITSGLAGNGSLENFINTQPVYQMGQNDEGEAVLSAPDFGPADFQLPEATTEIRDGAFKGAAMTAVRIPEDCASIGKYAFQNCTGLNKIRIPAGCEIGEEAFEGCTLLYVYGTLGSSAESYCREHDNCWFVEAAQVSEEQPGE